jgi:hypothetical protein
MVTPQDAVLPGRGEDLDETLGITVGDGAVQVVQSVARHFIGNALGLGLRLGETHARDLGAGKGDPG